MTAPIKPLSLDAQLIRDRLQEAQIGDVVGYDELSALIGRDVRQFGLGALATARKHAMANKNMVFQSIANEGLKRLSDPEIVKSVDGDLRRVRRIVGRSSLKITRVDFAKLSNEQKIDHNAKLSMLGALSQFSSSRSLTTIKNKVGETSGVLPLAKTLDMFR